MSFRIKLIQFLLHINEKLIFYPKLASYYSGEVKIKDPVIIDVGANKGQTISFFLKRYPGAEIYAFEPNRKIFNQLKNKFSSFPNVYLSDKGISNTNNKQLLKETIIDETSTFEDLNLHSGYLKVKSKILGVKPEEMIVNTYEVDVIRLDKFIDDLNLKHIHILKIDTEGHEYKCLQGLFSGYFTKIDYIQLEHHNDDMYLNAADYKAVEGILHQNGFKLHKKINHGFGNFDELLFKKKA